MTDGKAGDEGPCLAVAAALGLSAQTRRVRPQPAFAWAMPWGPVDPRERPDRPGSPLSPPFPDLLLASGRRSVPYVRAVKRGSRGRTFTVILKDPRTGPGAADLIWVPDHDRLRGSNVLRTPTTPHRVGASLLAALRLTPDPRLAALGTPRVAVLVGGPARQAGFSAEDSARLLAGLAALADAGASLAVTPSRRTPETVRRALRDLAAGSGGWFWDGTGENPLPAMLAAADAVVVTADSVNMLSEAVATGAPVLVHEPGRLGRRHRAFLDGLRDRGAIRTFRGRLDPFRYEPLDSTPVIAEAVATAYLSHRARLAEDAAAVPGRRPPWRIFTPSS